MQRRKVLAALASSWAAPQAAAAARPGKPALVVVAASVQRAMEEIAPRWMQASGHRVTLSYGSSGNLVRQVQQGLPAELFLSADEDFALGLARSGIAPDRGVTYARGRVALLVARDSALALDVRLEGLRAGWPQVRKFAIANPELAPYGKAAREVLQAVGLWEAARPKLVLGDNIAQATQFVATGAAQAGITALSLVAGADAGGLGRHLALPDSLHAPLRQRMVLLGRPGPAARALYQYLQTEPARAVLRRHGFDTDQL